MVTIIDLPDDYEFMVLRVVVCYLISMDEVLLYVWRSSGLGVRWGRFRWAAPNTQGRRHGQGCVRKAGCKVACVLHRYCDSAFWIY